LYERGGLHEKTRKAKSKRAGVARPKRVMVEFPQPLYQRVAEAAEEMAVNRSKLIRLALGSYLAARQKEKLEQQLAEGYIANAELNRAIAEEFSHIDGESF
jgi:metal-responsive CopG/Arc/MetJ family transcriptional regulator